jgi:hypothetical protein
MNRLITLTLLASLFVFPVFAQQPAAGTQPPKTTVIHAGHLLDVKTGKMLDNVNVVITGDKIERIVVLGAPSGHHQSAQRHAAAGTD